MPTYPVDQLDALFKSLHDAEEKATQLFDACFAALHDLEDFLADQEADDPAQLTLPSRSLP